MHHLLAVSCRSCAASFCFTKSVTRLLLTFDKSLSLACFGIGAFLMASIASFSCSYFEVVDGTLGGQPINGTVGLLRYYNESTMSSCAFYEQDQINWDINLQIATISGWGAPIAAAAGVSFGLVQVLCWPLMNPCIICSGLVCSVFLWCTFFIHASMLW